MPEVELKIMITCHLKQVSIYLHGVICPVARLPGKLKAGTVFEHIDINNALFNI